MAAVSSIVFDPAGAFGQHVKNREALGARHDERSKALRGRGFDRPGRCEFGHEEDRAGEADDPQDVG